jgi:hypothetical protein
MNARAAPRAATWLLERLGSGSRFEPLIGDLAEQFAEGRSRLWYWRQTTGALVVESSRVLRAHGLSLALAVLVGYGVTSLWVACNLFVFQPFFDSPAAASSYRWTGSLRFWGLLANEASLTALFFVSTWIVTRIHRTHRRAALMIFMAALTAQRLPALAQLVTDATIHSRLPPLLIPEIMRTCLQAVFVLLAGLWLIGTHRFEDMDRRTRCATVLVLVQVLIGNLLFNAWNVGAIAYPAAERYPLDAAEIASGLYLVVLLWRPRAAATRARVP